MPGDCAEFEDGGPPLGGAVDPAGCSALSDDDVKEAGGWKFPAEFCWAFGRNGPDECGGTEPMGTSIGGGRE